jgi:hypothetical protein
MEGKCYCCGKPGHKLPVCCHKGKPKDKWAINKAEINHEQQHAQQDKRIEEIEVITKKTEPESSASSKTDDMSVNTIGWAGTHYQLIQSLDMRDEILLDTASSTSLFGNKEYIASIKESKGKLELHTNGGPIFSTETASVDKFGNVWYNKDSVANIFSFTEMLKRYCIKYDSEIEDVFLVHTPEQEVKFKPLANGLYSLNLKKETQYQTHKGKFQVVNTLEENKTFFTPRQFK